MPTDGGKGTEVNGTGMRGEEREVEEGETEIKKRKKGKYYVLKRPCNIKI